jgi:hypothetical protein
VLNGDPNYYLTCRKGLFLKPVEIFLYSKKGAFLRRVPLIVWGIVAAITMPLLALYIRRALVVLMRRHRTLVRSRPALH